MTTTKLKKEISFTRNGWSFKIIQRFKGCNDLYKWCFGSLHHEQSDINSDYLKLRFSKTYRNDERDIDSIISELESW